MTTRYLNLHSLTLCVPHSHSLSPLSFPFLQFHTEALQQLLESDDKFGFIVIDGTGTLFGTVSGNTREVLFKLSVDLPKKHGRGGQSALRFARLRLERRHNYLRRVSELSTQFFINQTTCRPSVRGLILAGSADFKTELSKSDLFDPRLSAVVIKMVDVGYGGENGFNQAIELSSEELKNVKFVQEVKLISQFFDEIAQDTQKISYGIDDTLKALEMGAVQTLILWEGLEVTRWVLKNNQTGEQSVVFNSSNSIPPTTGTMKLMMMEVVESSSAVEWFAENFKKFGCKVEFITNRSQEGTQFCKGFGGIGALLRYQVDFASLGGGDGDLTTTDDANEEGQNAEVLL